MRENINLLEKSINTLFNEAKSLIFLTKSFFIKNNSGVEGDNVEPEK